MKPRVAIELKKYSKGGPYVSSKRIMNSSLKNTIDFRTLIYDEKIGYPISLKKVNYLTKQISKLSPDIIHFSGLQLQGFHLVLSCLFTSKKSLMTVRGFSSDDQSLGFFKKLIMALIIEPLTFLMVDNYYSNSYYTSKRFLSRLFSYKSYGYIYNYPPKKLNVKEDFRSKLGFHKNDILILTVSRITVDKGFKVLEKIINNYDWANNVKFLIVGDGDYKLEFEKRISNKIDKNVFLYGYRDDVHKFNSVSDIFLLTTLHETLSLALLEASVYSNALIASDTGGIKEIIENDYNGFKVKVNDHKNFIKKIIQLVSNNDLRKKLAHNSEKRVKEKFNSTSIDSEIKKVYKKILS